MNTERSLFPLKALLLLGPTGSGKSPLGAELERRGLRRCVCCHFDFGEQLRCLAGGKISSSSFSREELTIVRKALEGGLLLENEQFPIAEKLLSSFLTRSYHQSRREPLEVVSQTEFAEENPRTACTRRSDEGERGKHRLAGTMETYSRDAGEKIGLSPKILNNVEKWIVVMNGLPRHVGQALDVASWVDIRRVVHLQCDAKTAFARIGGDPGGDREQRNDDQWKAIQRRVARFERRTKPLLSFYRDQGARIDAIEVTASMTPDEAYEAILKLWKAT